MGTNLPAGFFTNKPGPLAGAGLAAMEQDRIAKLELPGALPPESLVILDGSISPTRAAVIVDTEGGAPADDLTVISTTLSDGTMLHDGMELTIRAKDASRVVTVKNSAAVNGILTVDGKDVLLGMDWWLTLRLESGSWRQKSLAQPQKAASKDSLGLMQVGDNLDVTAQGVVDVPLASESKQGIGRSATTAEVESGTTGNDGPAWVTPEQLDIVLKSLFVGKIELLPFRFNSLPKGWYFCNGERFNLSTPQGAALNGLSTDFKTDWGITISNDTISLPNLFFSDGRGYFLRSVDGSTRQVGSVQTDAIRNITGTFGGCLTRGGTGVFFNPGTADTDNYNGGPYQSNRTALDVSREVPTANENVVLNCGMTPAIFLGV